MEPANTQPKTHARTKGWLLPLTGLLVVVALGVAAWMWWVNNNNKIAEETPTVMASITDSGFTPATITIKKGQDVTWTNQGRAAYQIVADQNNPQGFKTSEALNPNDSYSFTFEDSGTYSYHDPANIDRKGTIIVE